ncbi:expressed unknown protein [Seminavis robusta]|uniref:Uncharacterized protein n=1 Tax=Seminavis robusta TaxID=568900 RepID=A0A9N8HVQ5_9STRA|nr:expressed unknown protein [Seminavis robusta]|eukprot:Sro1849_g301520.1 n/a (458) ;mRNA; f:13195-14568
MPSRKGKGRQSLGFGSKLQRAQFHQDWQSRLQEDYYAQRAQRHKQTTRQRVKDEKSHIQLSSSSGEGRRRACQSSLLRRLIAERQYWDRLEDRSWIYLHHGQQQQQRLASTSTGSAGSTSSTTSGSQRRLNDRLQDQSPPGWLIFHTTQSDEADPFAQEFLIGTSSSVPSLQSLALAQLAQSLPDYVQELGVPQMTDYLSILPGPALTVLSVTVSQLGLYTNQICQVIGRQSQLTRFSLVACPQCEETDPSWKELQPNQAIQALLLQPGSSDNNTPLVPILQSPTMVPESWEELDDSDDDQDQDQIYSSSIPPRSSPISILQSHRTSTSRQQQLERLELANLPHLQVHVLQQLLQANASTLTHLGLCGSLSSQTGPDVLWQLAQLAPNLRVLDVSGNASWVTEPVVRSVYDSYRALWESRDTLQQQSQQQQLLIIKATGCLSRSGQILMEMEFGTLF